MTLVVQIGRRVPKAWARRQAERVRNVLSFQAHMWKMIKDSMTMAKKKINNSGRMTCTITRDEESEDLNYKLEWIKVTIQGNEEDERDELNDTMKMYGALNKTFKKEIPKDEKIASHFKSKILSATKVDEAYNKGYGSIGEDSMANKLLELGILTHVELIEDWDTREVHLPTH